MNGGLIRPLPNTLASGLLGTPSSSDDSLILTLEAFGGVESPFVGGGVDSNTELMRISDPLPRNELPRQLGLYVKVVDLLE